jgi:molybdopterin synthase catalytic subunit
MVKVGPVEARVHTRLTDAPLSVDAAYAFVADPSSGGVVVFAGTVREQSEGKAVTGLTYEAWVERAEAGLDELARDVATRWPDVRGVWLEHRTGALAIGEPSVVVAVSAPHRAAAFEAARYGIDTLKATVPIWKQEHWRDGGAHWPGAPL